MLFKVGQRYMSVTEPELGLGLVSSIEDKTIVVKFAGSEVDRRYRSQNAPLKRVLFETGDKLIDQNGTKFEVIEYMDNDGLRIYRHADGIVPESELSSHISFNRPDEKLLQGQGDPQKLFQLRLQTCEYYRKLSGASYRGMLGGRMSLIPHQFFIADSVAKRTRPRVLLADEVGLGKTIEAGLIMHQLIVTGRASRAIVIVPDSLVYQWYLEMKRRFSLGFTFINQEVPLEPRSNPFLDNERVIVSMGLLKGSAIARELLAKAQFDLLVVDEAHQLSWSVETESPEYKIVNELAQRIEGVLLLTATPEQLGLEGHFARLRILDPVRFHNYHEFVEETKQFNNVAKVARSLLSKEKLDAKQLSLLKELVLESDFKQYQEQPDNFENHKKLIRHLIDRHGTGRVFFRNTRAALGEEFSFFPKRELHSYPLAATSKAQKEKFEKRQSRGEIFKLKALWLVDYLKTIQHKVFLICHSKEMVLELEELLRNSIPGIKTAVFHSGLSLMARDRQAAYFAEGDGAQILLSTEIGSEGRNFEFVQHLVLFDLPIKPDLLEQRIGRLDRIGQKGTVNIHVPYVEKTYEEVLYKWYNEALNCFLLAQSSSTLIYKIFHEELHQLLDDSKHQNWEKFIAKVQTEIKKINQEMEESRDFLIELNSFDPDHAKQIVSRVREIDQSPELKNYMESVFEQFGVDVEDLDDSSYYVKPGDNMFIPSFPSLPNEGVTLTYQRSRALSREDFQFLTWDHPMVVGSIDLLRNSSFGNATLVMRSEKKANAKTYLEVYFQLKVVAPTRLHIDRFLPPTLIRVLIDTDGNDLSEKFSSAFLDEKVVEADKETITKIASLPKDAIKKLIAKAQVHAQSKSKKLVDELRSNAVAFFKEELERFLELSKINPNISEIELKKFKDESDEIIKYFDQTQLEVDAIRLIV
ncbi:MAG: RNA polymerase-associated protein RapA [Bdellovibrio sp.]